MTSQTELRRIFNKVYNNQTNYMTPIILKYYSSNGTNFICELSIGTDFKSNKIYGVTVLKYENFEWIKCDLSKMFNSKPDAENYCNKLTGRTD